MQGERVDGRGEHPHQRQLALETRAGQLHEVWRSLRGASGLEVTRARTLTVLPSCMADVGVGD